MVPGPALKCQCPADIYLLLKSSDFISHDLDHAFEMCLDRIPKASIDDEFIVESNAEDVLVQSASRLRVSDETGSDSSSDDEVESTIPKVLSIRKKEYEFELVLKKWFDMPKSQEWRCFVRDKQLLG